MGQCLSTGCGMTTILTCLLCGSRCNVGKLQASFAFFPPSPPSYSYEEGGDGTGTLKLTEAELQDSADMLLKDCPSIKCFARRLITPNGQSICVNHFDHASSSITLLWSHGNAEDLGHVFFICVQLAERLGVSIVAYDYEGCESPSHLTPSNGAPARLSQLAAERSLPICADGLSSGRPLESTLCSDVLCVYDYLIESGLKPEQIVLYGQSVGSGPSGVQPSHHTHVQRARHPFARPFSRTSPTCSSTTRLSLRYHGAAVWLATKRDVHALILHSPLASGLRSLIPESQQSSCYTPAGFCSPVVMFSTCDMFPNFKRIARVRWYSPAQPNSLSLSLGGAAKPSMSVHESVSRERFTRAAPTRARAYSSVS